ncbi:penicillin acylase family protein [Brevibacterium album]|uniref:penicillin acylase family protein n=1 Tax=Brevibacterium album TaxID=417948 RepID=UPI00040B8735|nr:penicillin acylase family protein [Brevibacterium album]
MPQHLLSTRPPGAGKPARGRPRLRRLLAWTTAGVVVLALVASALGLWSVRRAFPQTTGTIEAAGLHEGVTVQRDAHGIPTLTASRSDDLFFAQGFVHAQDRFWEMDFRRHMTAGRLSELFGESQLGTDAFLRTLGWHRTAQQEVEDMPPEARSHYEAYAAGVNAYLEERGGGGLALEYTVLGLQNPGYAPEPWTPADSAAWLKAMAWDLRTNIEDETARALLARDLDAERLAELYPGYPLEEHPVIMAEDPAGEQIAEAEVPAPSGASGRDADPAGSAGTAGEVQAGAASSASAATASATPTTASAVAAEAGLSSLGDLLGRVDALVSAQGEGVGSNSWVVSGEHTESGAPLLANDPHLGASMPSVWTQMQLRCSTVSPECPFDVGGFSFSGLPGIVIGHNQQIAWGFTNLTTDVADLYVERVEDDGYWKDGEKHAFETRTETLRVAGGEDVEIEVRSTGHGPLVSDLTPEFTDIAAEPRVGAGTGEDEVPVGPTHHADADASDAGTAPTGTDAAESTELPPGENALSLRWTALDPGTTAQSIFTLNLAEDFADFREAASRFDVPAQNLVYADREGNIGYQAPGRLPVRGGGDGWLPQPGWDSAYDWQGFIPFEEQPVAYNPDSGYIVTANNAIVNDDYPHFLSRDWDYGDRAARIDELLRERIAAGPVTSEDMAQVQMDNEAPFADALQGAYASIDPPKDPRVRDALSLLADWDGQNDADSPAAAFANVLWNRVTEGMMSTQATAMQDSAAARSAAEPQEPEDIGIARDDQSRLARVFALQLDDEESPWWGGSRTRLLQTAAVDAYEELAQAQGADPAGWNWGELHALTLRSGTFGESGIAPVEALFNRGPYPVGGGSGVVNATGWGLDDGYETVTVPSMRMVIDLADWDASTWHHLTGASGHAFHPHYADQAEDWAHGEQFAWAFTDGAVRAAAEDTLTLVPG